MTDSTSSSDRKWPYRPDLDQFRHQAKELLKSYRVGDANAVAEVQRHERAPDPSTFALHDAQRVLARSYGFPSWQKLKSYVQTIQPYWRPLELKSVDDANKFLRLACITYFDDDHPSRRVRARQLFAEKPHLAKANIYTAAAVGDVAAVADFLAKRADVQAKGGPFNWEPLLYAAYSRLDSEAEEHSTLEAARLLLEAGADPNAGFLWEGGYVEWHVDLLNSFQDFTFELVSRLHHAIVFLLSTFSLPWLKAIGPIGHSMSSDSVEQLTVETLAAR